MAGRRGGLAHPLAQRRCGALRRCRWVFLGSSGVEGPRLVRRVVARGRGSGRRRGGTPSVIFATHRSAVTG